MPHDDQLFTPEEVDEQIDWLERASRAQPPTPNTRVIQGLHRLYENERSDAQSVDAVWQRLLERGAVPAPQPQRARPSGPPGRQHDSGPPPQAYAPAAPARRGLSTRILAIVAAVLLVVVIGGLVAGIILVRQHSPIVSNQPTVKPGQTSMPGQTATATPAPKPVGIYGIINGNTLVALNSADGSVRWQSAFAITGYPQFYVSSTNVYIQDLAQQVLTAINEQDGSQRWQKTNTVFLGAANGLVFVSQSHYTIIAALNESDGSQRWTFQVTHSVADGLVAPLVASADTVYIVAQDSVSTNDGNPHYFLYALNIADGAQRWLIQSQFYFEYVTLAGDTLYLFPAPNSQGDLGAFNVSDGTERWHMSVVGVTQFLPPTVVDGVVYVPMDGYIQAGGGPAFIYAYSASDGKQLWHSEQAQAGVAYSQVTVDHGVVYATDQKNIYAFNATNGQQLWRQQVGYMYIPPTPVVENGLIYVNWYGSGRVYQDVRTSALNEANGQDVWTFTWPNLTSTQEVGVAGGPGSPTVLNGVAYLYLYPFSPITALDTRNGNQLWQKNGLETIGIITDS